MSSRGKRAIRLEHANRLLHGTNRRRHPITSTTPITQSLTESPKQHANLVGPKGSSSVSFDMLSVESTTASTSTTTLESTATLESTTILESTEEPTTSSQPTSTRSVRVEPSTTLDLASQTPIANEKPLRLEVQQSSSIERTTLIVLPTFSNPVSSTGSSKTTTALLPVATAGVISTSLDVGRTMTWTRSSHTVTHTLSASTSAHPVPHPPMSHPHVSPALIVFMALGGVASLAVSLYIFKRVRHRALHVSRSQFQITTPPNVVPGSSSEKSFVSGGQPAKHEKNGYLDASVETPLWGGKEKFSPQIGGVVDYPPVAHCVDGSRAPMRHRQSMLDTIRRYTPGNRLSKSGPGWNAMPHHQDYSVPTVRVTDMDTRHNRLGSNSTLSSGVGGSPDPNSATIQVASVTRTLSAAASYRVGSPLTVAPGLDHPRPAPKIPTKALVFDRAPPVPAMAVMSSDRAPTPTGKKLDPTGRGKITVTDISKPQLAYPESASDADPMFMYAKYSASLGVREGSPTGEPLRHESSMAKKIAQIAQSKSTIMTADSQVSLSNRDTRALAAAAGVGSPIPGEDHMFRGFDQNTRATGAPPLGKGAIASSSLFPGSPGLGGVGNAMLRTYGESGSMLPAFLETPAIGLDGRSSYLSMNLGSGSGSMTGPSQAISAKSTSATLEAEQSAGTLSPSMLSDDPSRRTIASAYSQDWIPLSQQAHLHQNPDYKSPTYSIYNYYGPDRASTAPRMPSLLYGDREEPQIGGAM